MLGHDGKPSMLLQQPGQMGPLRLKNRVVMGPMGTNFGTTDGFSTESALGRDTDRAGEAHDRIAVGGPRELKRTGFVGSELGRGRKRRNREAENQQKRKADRLHGAACL